MSGTKKVIHSANSTVNPNALSSNILSCNPFSYSTCLSMQHSIFVVNPINKTTYGNEIWVLDTNATYHIVHHDFQTQTVQRTIKGRSLRF